MGSPSWSGFAEGLIKQVINKGGINYSIYQQISHLDHKKQLSIMRSLAQSLSISIDYEKILQPRESAGSSIYDSLLKIGCTYVTTNYDKYLDTKHRTKLKAGTDISNESHKEKTDSIVCRPDEFDINLLGEKGAVIHLHGSLIDEDTMIITTPDYLRHYINEKVILFLEELFKRYTVLFVGYGLEEAEILEHILRKGLSTQLQERRRFWLFGCYSHEQQVISLLEKYYTESFGVHLVPFNMDQEQYAQLDLLIKDWSKRIEVGEASPSDEVALLKEVTDEQ